jgi:hypothetical protein
MVHGQVAVDGAVTAPALPALTTNPEVPMIKAESPVPARNIQERALLFECNIPWPLLILPDCLETARTLKSTCSTFAPLS